MTASAEAQLDAVMNKGQFLQPLADAGFDHQIDGALFEQPGPYALLNILAAAIFDDDGFDAA